MNSYRSPSSSFQTITPYARFITILLVILYLVDWITLSIWQSGWSEVIALSSLQLEQFYPWQYLSYFLFSYQPHGDASMVLKLLFAILVLLLFGSQVELQLGKRRLLILILVTGCLSGLIYHGLYLSGGLFYLADHQSFSLMLRGPDAVVMGIITALAYLSPDLRLMVLGIFPLRVKFLAIGTGLLMVFVSSGKAVDFVVLNLLGFMTAYLYLQTIEGRYGFLNVQRGINWIRSRQLGRNKPDFSQYSATSTDTQASGVRPHRAAEVINKDDWEYRKVEQLLNKIRKLGFDSLEEEEKAFLEKNSYYYRSKYLNRDGS